MQAAALAGGHMDARLWLRLCQAILASVIEARGGSLERAPAGASRGNSDSEARDLGLAGCCIVNARQLLDPQPVPVSEASDEGVTAWCACTRRYTCPLSTLPCPCSLSHSMI